MRLGYRLQINGRCRHAEAYVRRCLEDASFQAIMVAQADLRLEGGVPVVELVVTAARASCGWDALMRERPRPTAAAA